MELSDEERTFLHFYKGNYDVAVKELTNWKGNIGLAEMGHYTSQLKYENVNLFLNFINNPTVELMNKVKISKVDYLIEMVLCLTELASRCAYKGYQYGGVFYRYEDKRNLKSYKSGVIPSFKSTSFDRRAVEIFKKPGRKLLEIETAEFCPCLPIDALITNHMGDEYELLFPPFIDCYEENGKLIFHVDENKKEENINWEKAQESANNFDEQFQKDKERGIVSDKLREYCKEIYNFLRLRSLVSYKSSQLIANEMRRY